jgi:hypothetical protein
MPLDRSVGRNVHIFDARDPTKEIGGLLLCAGVSRRNFYDWVAMIITTDDDWHLEFEDNRLPRDDAALSRGDYFLRCDGQFRRINNITR